jgi:hypothetical protein
MLGENILRTARAWIAMRIRRRLERLALETESFQFDHVAQSVGDFFVQSSDPVRIGSDAP